MDELNINGLMNYQFSVFVVYMDTKDIEDFAQCVLTSEDFFKTVYLCGNQKLKTLIWVQCIFLYFFRKYERNLFESSIYYVFSLVGLR